MEIEVRPANAVDQQILAWADAYSPEEISKRLSGVVKPTTIAARIQTLLKQKSWLSAAQEDQLITLRMKRVLEELESRFLDVDNAKLRLSYLKEIGSRLDKRQAATEVDLNSFYAKQAFQVGQLLELGLQGALAELRKAHPDIEDAEARAALKEALPAAMAEIQARTVDG